MRRSKLDRALIAGPSQIAGRGLFAVEPIPAGKVLVELGGVEMSDAEFAEYVRGREKWSALAIDEGRNLVQDLDDEAAFGNHSCDPNAWLHGARTIVARRVIAPGEEVTTDYATQTVEASWRMTCECGAEQCRQVITGSDWKLIELQSRYRGHFSPFIEARIAGANRR